MPRYAKTPGAEAFIKRDAVRYARACGFIVIDTATNRRTPRAGIPDVVVAHPRFGNQWVAVDFKRLTGKPTPSQQELLDAGVLDICSGVDGFIVLLKIKFPGVTK